jgi:hypothetical protein
MHEIILSIHFLPILLPLLLRVSSSLWQHLVQTGMISHHTFTNFYNHVILTHSETHSCENYTRLCAHPATFTQGCAHTLRHLHKVVHTPCENYTRLCGHLRDIHKGCAHPVKIPQGVSTAFDVPGSGTNTLAVTLANTSALTAAFPRGVGRLNINSFPNLHCRAYALFSHGCSPSILSSHAQAFLAKMTA